MKTLQLATGIFVLLLHLPAVHGDDKSMSHEIKVSMKAPDGGWSLSIDEVFRVDDKYWVIATAKRAPGAATAAISTITDSVSIDGPALPSRVFILGKTWNWKGREPYEFLADRSRLDRQMKAVGAKSVFRRDTDGTLSPDDFVQVTVGGTLTTGIQAIGGETTGATVTAGEIVWELDLDGTRELRGIALKLNGQRVLVTGHLTRKVGVEIPVRWIVKVSTLKRR
jgi:hypothetical protein